MITGAIDCDIHPALPSTHTLLPYLDEYWRAHVEMRGLERDNYNAAAFPAILAAFLNLVGAALVYYPYQAIVPVMGNPSTLTDL